MEKRQLAPGVPAVSVLGFGGGHIGSPDLSEDSVGELLNKVLDAGVNFFDTARGYGLSEERIGRHLSWRRAETVLSTKVGYGVEGRADWTYDCVREGIDQAARRLQTEVIDVVFLHSCNLEILKRGEVIAALRRAKEEGRVRAIGYSGENDELRWALWEGGFDVLQCSVNLADQRVIAEVLPEAKKRGVGVVAKRPLANSPWRFTEVPTGDYCEPYWHRLKAMKVETLAEKVGSWGALALRFAASCSVGSCIVGTGKLAHLVENASWLQAGELEKGVYEKLRKAFEKADNGWKGEL